MAAAKTLSKKQVQGTLRQQGNKKVATKNVLCSPFEVGWPRVKPENKKKVFEVLTKFFSNHRLERPKLRHCKNKKDRKKERDSFYAAIPDETKEVMKNIVIGINGVTKGLERNQLNLVLVDRSANPAILTNHLISLSVVSSCSAAALVDLSELLSPLLHVTSAIAVGFKKIEQGKLNDLEELVSNISNKLPKLSVPWLQASGLEKQENETIENSSCSSLTKDAEKEDEENVDKSDSGEVDVSKFYIMKKDRKRPKMVQRSAPMDTSEGYDSLSDENVSGIRIDSHKRKSEFEGAKVKKLKGNPNKVKKKKKKKSK